MYVQHAGYKKEEWCIYNHISHLDCLVELISIVLRRGHHQSLYYIQEFATQLTLEFLQ